MGFQQIEIDRFGEKSHGAKLRSATAPIIIAVSGHHHYGQVGALLLDNVEQLEPVHTRHVDV
jgi:hypothetical protein